MQNNTIDSSALKLLSDHDLIAGTKDLRNREAKTTACLCAHLAEIYRRRLYLDYEANMYTYCQNHLGLTDGEMALRVQVAKKGAYCPRLLEAMALGRISLTVAAKLCPHLGEDVGQDPEKMIDHCSGMSKRQVEEYLVALAPKPMFRDSIRAAPTLLATEQRRGQSTAGELVKVVESKPPGASADAGASPECTDGRRIDPRSNRGEMKPATPSAYNVRFAASKQFKEKFERLRELIDKPTRSGGLSMQDVLEYALDHTLNSKDPKRRKQRRDRRQKKTLARPDDAAVTPENERIQQKNSEAQPAVFDEKRKNAAGERFIPRKLQDETFARADYQCEHKSPTGERCSARGNLHIDHLMPLAFGGRTEPDNIQCLCASHHRQKTAREHGRTFIAAKIMERRKAKSTLAMQPDLFLAGRTP